jgi:hypothetical protein
MSGVTIIHVRGMSGDKMVEVATEIRTGHLPNTSTQRYCIERLRNSTKNISFRLEPGTSRKRGRNYTLSAAKFGVSTYSQIVRRKILPLLEMNSCSSVHSQRLYTLFQ